MNCCKLALNTKRVALVNKNRHELTRALLRLERTMNLLEGGGGGDVGERGRVWERGRVGEREGGWGVR